MATEDHDPNAVRVFWEDFDSAWHAGGARSAEEISLQLQRVKNYSLAASTIRGWLEHNRLPRKDDDFTELCLLLVGQDRTNELMTRLQAARRTARTKRTSPNESPPSKGVNKSTVIWRQLYRSLRLWHAMVATVVAVVLGVLVGLVLLPEGEAPWGAPVPPARPPSGAGPSTAADDWPCPTPTVRAVSKNRAASAQFCADRLEFLLSDDRPDGKSAVLVVRVNGKEWPAWFNSNGYATSNPDGSQGPRNPPQHITVSFGSNDTAEFRVCVGHYNPQGTYPADICGDWTPIWPRH